MCVTHTHTLSKYVYTYIQTTYVVFICGKDALLQNVVQSVAAAETTYIMRKYA